MERPGLQELWRDGVVSIQAHPPCLRLLYPVQRVLWHYPGEGDDTRSVSFALSRSRFCPWQRVWCLSQYDLFRMACGTLPDKEGGAMRQRVFRPLLTLLWALLGCSVAGRAQDYDLVQQGEVVGDLSQAVWRFHPGDDPRWADPGYDDSQWSLLRANAGWDEQGFRGYRGYAWYRLRVRPAKPGQQLALAPAQIDMYQLFCDGKAIGGVGNFGSRKSLYLEPYTLFTCKAEGDTVVLALRVWTNGPVADLIGTVSMERIFTRAPSPP